MVWSNSQKLPLYVGTICQCNKNSPIKNSSKYKGKSINNKCKYIEENFLNR